MGGNTSTGGMPGTGGVPGTGGMPGAGGTGSVDPCLAPNTCQSPTVLSGVSGDTTSPIVSAQGSTSEWLRLRISEDDSSFTPRQLSFTATLTSPAGDDFDLFAYVNTGSDVVECTSVSDSSAAPAGQVDSVYLLWGESGLLPNGVDDDRWVTLEVRAKSASCTAPWSLTIEGDT